jgi:hypothetical protein
MLNKEKNVKPTSEIGNDAKPIVIGRSEQLTFDCPEPQWHNSDILRYNQCTFCRNKELIKS